MASGDSNTLERVTTNPPPTPPPSSSSSSFSGNWKERIFFPTLLAGIGGGGVGLVSKHRKVHGLANISASYATNFAIVTGSATLLFHGISVMLKKMILHKNSVGAREFVRVSRKSGSDDLINSAVAGFGTGAILGRLQGGQFGAYCYSIIFAVVGTAVDFATIKLRPTITSFRESMKKDGWFKLPEWSPIRVLDEEALAAKQAREKKLYNH